MKKQHIVLGQYLGIGILTTISIICALGVSVIPREYVGLLGLIPIYLGAKAYVDHKRESKNNEDIGQQELQNDENNKHEETINIEKNPIINFVRSFINPSIIKVASVTIANGGDNIGIYVPLFSSMSSFDILITVIVFLFFTALWCFIGQKVAEHPFIQKNIEKNKHIFVPVIFIGLGIFILMKSGTITFIFKILLL